MFRFEKGTVVNEGPRAHVEFRRVKCPTHPAFDSGESLCMFFGFILVETRRRATHFDTNTRLHKNNTMSNRIETTGPANLPCSFRAWRTPIVATVYTFGLHVPQRSVGRSAIQWFVCWVVRTEVRGQGGKGATDPDNDLEQKYEKKTEQTLLLLLTCELRPIFSTKTPSCVKQEGCVTVR